MIIIHCFIVFHNPQSRKKRFTLSKSCVYGDEEINDIIFSRNFCGYRPCGLMPYGPLAVFIHL